jgi:activating signal cointegrator complex subunit 3
MVWYLFLFQNAARITRSLFEICLKKGWPIMASRLLNLSKTIDKKIWGFETPLRQFSILPQEIISKLEARNLKVDKLREMDAKEIGKMNDIWYF